VRSRSTAAGSLVWREDAKSAKPTYENVTESECLGCSLLGDPAFISFRSAEPERGVIGHRWQKVALSRPNAVLPKELIMKDQTRKVWVPPTVVRRPVSETLHGVGASHDAVGGEFPLQS
jgi:hypothetical protein